MAESCLCRMLSRIMSTLHFPFIYLYQQILIIYNIGSIVFIAVGDTADWIIFMSLYWILGRSANPVLFSMSEISVLGWILPLPGKQALQKHTMIFNLSITPFILDSMFFSKIHSFWIGFPSTIYLDFAIWRAAYFGCPLPEQWDLMYSQKNWLRISQMVIDPKNLD